MMLKNFNLVSKSEYGYTISVYMLQINSQASQPKFIKFGTNI